MMMKKGKTLSIENPRRILVVQLGDIGDVVLTLPALKALRNNFPKATIEVAVREKAALLLEGSTFTDRILSVDRHKNNAPGLGHQAGLLAHIAFNRFDLAIELRTGTRGAFLSFLSGATHRIGRYSKDDFLRNKLFTHLVYPENEDRQHSVDHNLNILAPLLPSLYSKDSEDLKAPCLTLPPEILQKMGRRIRQQMPLPKKTIVLHPFSIWSYKELTREQYVGLIQHIKSTHDCYLVITGSGEERIKAQEIIDMSGREVFNFAGKTLIIEMAGLLKLATLVISIDTSAIHIAAAVNTPTVSIFGPSSQTNWAPRGKKHVVISSTMECVPCRKKGCNNTLLAPCLTTLSLDYMAKTIDTHLATLHYQEILHGSLVRA